MLQVSLNWAPLFAKDWWHPQNLVPPLNIWGHTAQTIPFTPCQICPARHTHIFKISHLAWDGWMVGCLGLWNWDLKSRTESVQRLFFHFHVQPSLLWNFWTTFCDVFQKQVWNRDEKMCFLWISYDFITFIERLTTTLQSPPTLLSLPRYGGRSQECPDRHDFRQRTSYHIPKKSFFSYKRNSEKKSDFFTVFFFEKSKFRKRSEKCFLTWAGTGPSQRHVISRGRELFKHYIDYRCYLLG